MKFEDIANGLTPEKFESLTLEEKRNVAMETLTRLAEYAIQARDDSSMWKAGVKSADAIITGLVDALSKKDMSMEESNLVLNAQEWLGATALALILDERKDSMENLL